MSFLRLVDDARAADFEGNPRIWQELHVAARDMLERMVVTVTDGTGTNVRWEGARSPALA